MQTSINFFVFLGKLPKIFVFLVILYILIKVFKAFMRDCFGYSEESFLKRIYNFFDPYHQSIFCYKYKWYTIILLVGVIYLLCKIYIPPEMISDEKGMYAAQSILYNHATYLINYLAHENLGHNMFCNLGSKWFCYFSGDFIQILLPCIIYLFSLQLRGGLFFSPVLLYWLSSAFYDAGIYASDAAVSKLALTSSDMVTDYAAGIAKGDWYYILTPFNALPYAQIIGLIFEVIACIIFALAIYSAVEYFRRLTPKDMPENSTMEIL